MSYREVPTWLGDAESTVVLDCEEVTAEEMTPESVIDSGGTWTAETDAGAVEVRLAWSDRVFTHASATLPDADDRLGLGLSSSPASSADAGTDGNGEATVFVPESDRHEFEVRLLPDDCGDHPDETGR